MNRKIIITTPKLPNDIDEAMIQSLHVSEGDVVQKESLLVTLQFGMNTLKVTAPSDGKVVRLVVSEKSLVSEQQTYVKEGDVLLEFLVSNDIKTDDEVSENGTKELIALPHKIEKEINKEADKRNVENTALLKSLFEKTNVLVDGIKSSYQRIEQQGEELQCMFHKETLLSSLSEIKEQANNIRHKGLAIKESSDSVEESEKKLTDIKNKLTQTQRNYDEIVNHPKILIKDFDKNVLNLTQKYEEAVAIEDDIKKITTKVDSDNSDMNEFDLYITGAKQNIQKITDIYKETNQYHFSIEKLDECLNSLDIDFDSVQEEIDNANDVLKETEKHVATRETNESTNKSSEKMLIATSFKDMLTDKKAQESDTIQKDDEDFESDSDFSSDDTVEVDDTEEQSKEHRILLENVDEYLRKNPSYSVILGLSSMGKSSGLEMMLHTWLGADYLDLDVEQTDSGKFNPIKNIVDKQNHPINLVDLAGEDFLSWLNDNNCSRVANMISKRRIKKKTASASYKKECFEKLLKQANHMYIMLPTRENENTQDQYSPIQTINKCAKALANLLVNTYDKNNKVTFIVNHVDELGALKAKNAYKPYFFVDDKNLCPRYARRQDDTIDKVQTKTFINEVMLGIGSENTQLMDKFVELVHGTPFKADDRCEYVYRDNTQLNYKLNTIQESQTTEGVIFHYKWMAILYPIHIFLNRKLNEFVDSKDYDSSLEADVGDDIQNITVTLEQNFAKSEYEQSIANLKEVILDAFAINKLTLPNLKNKQTALKTKIADIDALIKVIEATIKGVEAENINTAQTEQLDMETIKSQVDSIMSLLQE